MKILVGAALAALSLASSPATAQAMSQEERDTTNKFYQMALECSNASLILPFLVTSLSKDDLAAMETESKYWLSASMVFAEELGYDAKKDSELGAFRMLAHLDLVGEKQTMTYFSAMHKSCHNIYVEVQKP